MENSLLSLCKEIEYQEVFDYDKRTEFFNKYQISTSVKYLNPIFVLGTLLELKLNHGGVGMYDDVCRHGMSHSGGVATAFNKEFNSHSGINKSPKIKYDTSGSNELVWLYRYVPSEKDLKRYILIAKKPSQNTYLIRLYSDEFIFSNRRLEDLKDFDIDGFIDEFIKDFT